MDPPHITEFASPRYFNKLKSLLVENAGTAALPQDDPTLSQTAGTITLPFHDRVRKGDDNVKSSDQKKRSLGHDPSYLKSHRKPGTLFNNRIPFRKPKPPQWESVIEEEEKPAVQRDRTLGELFFDLPNEIQLQIITPLPLPTILDLRLVSTSFHRLVSQNESSIARYHLARTIPAFAVRLYPAPELNLQYICGLRHRLHVSQKLTILVAEVTTKEIFLRDTESKWNDFLPQHTRMRRRLMPLIFTVFHFFEKYREFHVRHLLSNGIPLRRQPFTLNPIERQVMDLYSDELLLKVHQIFPLLLSSFSRRLRPPSYAGRLERSIKGMLKDKPADEIYANILVVGGLRQACRFWEIKGYNTRRNAVDMWSAFVKQEAVSPPQKSKLSVLSSLGRKKTAPIADVPYDASMEETSNHHDSGRCREWYCVKPTCNSASKHAPSDSPVFGTSLGLGPPMSPLPRDQLKLLLSDQQELTNMWLQTAEAIILERGIVENSAQIKRNTQVLLELIKEDASVMDEDWALALDGISRHAFEKFREADALGGV